MALRRASLAMSFAFLPVLAGTVAVFSQSSGQEPAPAVTVFGYKNFAAQAKIDADFLAVPDAKLAGQHLKTLTAEPHIASSKEDRTTADYVAAKFKEAGLDTEIVPYRVLLNQPRKVSFEAHGDDGAVLATGPTREHVTGRPVSGRPAGGDAV